MYSLVSMINSFIRDTQFSNPFENIFNNPLIAIIVSSFFGTYVLKGVAYTMCGMFYKKGSCPTLGSIGYMLFYCINIQVLIVLSKWIGNLHLFFSIYAIFVILVFILLRLIKRDGDIVKHL